MALDNLDTTITILYSTYYKVMLRVFREGLRSKLARKRLASSDYTTLEQAVEMAMSAELDELIDESDSFSISNENYEHKQKIEKDEMNLDSLKEIIKDMQKNIKDLQDNQNSNNRYDRNDAYEHNTDSNTNNSLYNSNYRNYKHRNQDNRRNNNNNNNNSNNNNINNIEDTNISYTLKEIMAKIISIEKNLQNNSIRIDQLYKCINNE